MDTLDRRSFLKGGLAGIGLLMAGQEIVALAADEPLSADEPFGAKPVSLAVVGAGQWGRTLLAAAMKQPAVTIAGCCDTYQPFLQKCKDIAPAARLVTDYRTLLDDKTVEAIVVATPSHMHKGIVLDSLQAGKHVYCEAPLAHSPEDARAIASAAATSKSVFLSGFQGRSNSLYQHVWGFVRTGVLGTVVRVDAQWQKKGSWRRAAPTPEREQEMNWRLSRATSPGLVGEQGIHHLDLALWFLGSTPTSVLGSGYTFQWNDGREAPDTVQCALDFPKGVSMSLACTLASSCGGSYVLFQGTNSSLLVRDDRAWMIKEADAPTLGWEVYARKEPCNGDSGICLVADATKLVEEGKDPGKVGSLTPEHDALYYAFRHFAECVRGLAMPVCGADVGLQSTLTALRANEAVLSNSKLEYAPYLSTG